jgi:hypothetical protein
VKTTLGFFIVLALASAAHAQPPDKIRIFLDARSEGKGSRDEAAAQLFASVRSGLEGLKDVEFVPRDLARRIIWIVTGTTPGTYAASVIVTERYDRETLMVLGIEDDDMASRMMALQIVNDHQIFTGPDLAALARRIVAAVDEGVLRKIRSAKR